MRWGAGYGPLIVEGAFPHIFPICALDEYAHAQACMATWRGLSWCSACSVTLTEIIAYPTLLYLVMWAVPYACVLFCLEPWLTRIGKETLYGHMAWSVRIYPAKWRRHGFMLNHVTGLVVFGMASVICWHSFLLHTLYLIALLGVAIRNGATFIFRVTALHYADQVLAKNPHIGQLKEDGSSKDLSEPEDIEPCSHEPPSLPCAVP